MGARLAVRYPRPNHALQLTASSLVSLEVTWENPRHPVPGRDRPIQPGSPESGAEPGSSRPELLKPVQWSGAVEPVSARAGRQECLWVPCFVGIEVAQAPWEVALRPSGERWAVPTAARGVVTLVERLQALTPPCWCWQPPGPGAGRHSGVGHGGPPRRRGQPATGARLCPRHRTVGQDGGVGGPRAGAFCCGDPPAAPPVAGRPAARAARSAGASPATGRQVDCGTAPPGGDERTPPAGPCSASPLAQRAPGQAGR
jgi:hypothetical protein